jgi:hypothetical protein
MALANMSKTSVHKTSSVVLIASAVTMLLYMVPFLHPVAYPFMLLSTLVHEMGHGFAALLVGGHFDSFKMWSDGSGVASINGQFGAFSRAVIAAAGLVGPAIVASLFFIAVKSEHYSRVVLATFGIILTLSILLVVRNLFGVFFVAFIVVVCFYFSFGGGQKYSKIVLSFLAMQLSLSVFSRSDYLFTNTAVTSAGAMPSDVAQIADALFLPYWFWGILCGLFSIAVMAFGIRQLFK